jgi:phosphodiesterase/alkaline phosphatase D-like protein
MVGLLPDHRFSNCSTPHPNGKIVHRCQRLRFEKVGQFKTAATAGFAINRVQSKDAHGREWKANKVGIFLILIAALAEDRDPRTLGCPDALDS